MSLERRQLILLLALVLLLIGVAYYQFLWSPLAQEVQTATETTARMQDTVDAAINTSDALNQARKEESAFKLEYERTLSHIPSQPGIPGIITLLQSTARDNQCSLTSISYSEGQGQAPEQPQQPGQRQSLAAGNKANSAASTVKAINFNITINGAYQQIKSFVMALEDNQRLFSLSNINLAAIQAPQTAVETSPQPTADTGAATNGARTVAPSSPPVSTLTLSMTVTAYYDDTVPTSISGLTNQVSPPAQSRENPFR